MKKTSNRAFTLIELLIVISIVSLLATIVMYSVSEAQIRAQDTSKKEEVRQVNNALEIRKSSNQFAPTGTVASYGLAYNENSSEYESAMQELVDSGAIDQIPRSPNGRDYFYVVEEPGKEGIFGAILRSDNELEDNNGCFFSNDNYGCSVEGATSPYIHSYDRTAMVTESDSCSTGSCSSVAVSDGGGDSELATEEYCFGTNSGATGAGQIISYYWNNSNCPRDAVVIPSTIDGVSVSFIGASAFSYVGLTSISIPNSVTSIGASAFSNNQLTSVSIPNGVTHLGPYAFVNNSLTSISIPNSLSSIFQNTFQNNQITSVFIPDNITSVGTAAFINNPLTSVSIKSGTTYQSNSFATCTVANGCISQR